MNPPQDSLRTIYSPSACCFGKNCLRPHRSFQQCPAAQDTPREVQVSQRWQLSASQVLDAPAKADSKILNSVDSVLPRVESHLHASSSTSNGFYEGAGPGTEEVALLPSIDAFAAEVLACDEIADILEIVGDEADLMTGTSLVVALKRVASLSKQKAAVAKQKSKREMNQLSKSADFVMLLSLIQAKAIEMSASDIADCLWALAVMDAKSVRMLRLLQREVEARVADMNERELATVTWSFATLRFNPGALLDLLAETASPKLKSFEAKGLSMMLWAYSKLEHFPPREFSAQVISILDQDLTKFSNQSIANIVYALGKLKHPLDHRLCQRIEKLVVENGKYFNDVELANILYGFVKMSYQAPGIVEALEKRISKRTLAEDSASMVWASLVWGAASLGLSLKSGTLDSLLEWGLAKPEFFNPSSICNLAWGLAVLGEVTHPVYVRVIDAVVKSHEQRTLEPRLLRQLYQAVSSARVMGAEVEIPQELEQTAYKWWRKGSLSKSMSMTHEAVARAIKRLGLDSAAQHNAGYGLPLIDVAIEAVDQDIAIMIVPPQEYAINPGGPTPLGRIRAATRLLETAGWRVVVIPASSLHKISSERAVIRAVSQILKDLGVKTDSQKAVQAAPKSVPKSISSNWSRWDDTADPDNLSHASAARYTPTELAPMKGIVVQSIDSNGSLREVAAELASEPADEVASNASEASRVEDTAERSRQRRRQVSEAMKGDFMEGWVSLADWKSQKQVIPIEARAAAAE